MFSWKKKVANKSKCKNIENDHKERSYGDIFVLVAVCQQIHAYKVQENTSRIE